MTRASLEFVAKAYHQERVGRLEDQLAATEAALDAIKEELRVCHILGNNADQLAMQEGDARRYWHNSYNRTIAAVMAAVSAGTINANVAQRWINRDLSEDESRSLSIAGIPTGTTFENVEAARVRGVLLRGVALAKSEREALYAASACAFLEEMPASSAASQVGKHNVPRAYRASAADVVAHARMHGWEPPR